MFDSWRYKLREAEQALADGKLDDASRLLQSGELQRCHPARRLRQKVAQQYAQRAGRRVRTGDGQAGWNDLAKSRDLAGETEDWIDTRQGLISEILQDAERLLESGEPQAALRRLEDLDVQRIDGSQIRTLRDVARRIDAAHGLCRKGKFAEAEAQLITAQALRSDLEVLGRLRQRCRQNQGDFRSLSEQLHQVIGQSAWSEALKLADCLLDIAPENPLAREARRRAWTEVDGQVGSLAETRWPSGGGASEADRADRAGGENRAAAASSVALQSPSAESVQAVMGVAAGNVATIGASDTAAASDAAVTDSAAGDDQRFLLWVDGVGGYLFCLADEVIIGQSSPTNRVAIPILADVSRKHASIVRHGEGYLLTPLDGSVRLKGRKVSGPSLLSDGDELELGDTVRMRFVKPHALSASARLDFVSRHRTQPTADGVMLMAESCVLGPKWQNHVVCRDWPDDVVLYRNEGKLFCRSMQPLEINGVVCDGRGEVRRGSHISGDDFSMTLEDL